MTIVASPLLIGGNRIVVELEPVKSSHPIVEQGHLKQGGYWLVTDEAGIKSFAFGEDLTFAAVAAVAA